VRSAFPDYGLNYRVITLKEPPKKLMVEFLDREHRLKHGGQAPTRCARVEVIVKKPSQKPQLWEVLVDLGKGRIAAQKHLEGKHTYIDPNYMREVENACLADKRVQEEIRRLNLPPGSTAIVEPWAYATDGMHDMTDRLTMVCVFSLPRLTPSMISNANSLQVLVLLSSRGTSRCQLLRLPAGCLRRGF